MNMPNRRELKMLIISLRKSFVFESQGKNAWSMAVKSSATGDMWLMLQNNVLSKVFNTHWKRHSISFQSSQRRKRKLKVFFFEAGWKEKLSCFIWRRSKRSRKAEHLEMNPELKRAILICLEIQLQRKFYRRPNLIILSLQIFLSSTQLKHLQCFPFGFYKE